VERERKIEQLISDKDSLIEELQETKNALASSMNSGQSQDHLLKELNSLKESFNAKAQENDELSSIVNGLKQENIQLKAYIQDSMSSIQKSTDLESQAKESKNLLAARNEELRVLKVENYALVEQLNELRKHVVNLTNNNAILQDEYHDLKRKYNSVHKSTESVQSSTESISKDELIERLDFAVKQRDDFKAQLSDLSTKYQDIILQFEKVSHLNEQLQMELQTVPAYIEKYHEERKTLRAKALQKDRLVEKLVKQHEILLAKYQYLLSTLKSDSVDDNGETVAEIRKSRDLVDVAVEILEEQNQIGISTPNGIVRSSALRRLSAVTNGTILFPPCEDCLTDLVEV
jgi:chromosome segregation ATPase